MALGGWIKLHRALADHHIASDPDSLSVWIHLLMMANHKATKRMLNGQVIAIQAGQLVTSRRSISEKTGVQESKVERVISRLKSEQQIEQVGKSKFRLISIVNWASYQSDEQQNEQEMNSKRTADEQQMNTPGEVSISPNGDTDTQECKEGKEKNIGRKAEPRDKTRAQWIAELASLGVDKKHAGDWLTIRKQKRSPLTDTALEGVKREAVEAGVTLPEAIRIAAENGWQGFKASWLQSKTGSPGLTTSGRHHGFSDNDYFEGLNQREDGTYGL